MTSRPTPPAALRRAPLVAPAEATTAGTRSPSSPAAPAESPTTVSPAGSARRASDLILATTDVNLAAQLQTHTRAWVVHPDAGKGEVRVVVVVDPEMPTNPDATWLEAQLIEGLGFKSEDIDPATLIWGPTDDQRT